MVPARKHHELYEELGAIVGAKYVSDNRGVLLSYTRDISTFPPAKPQGIVVRPGSVEEVVELVRLANQTRTPLIPMGGKASVSGVPSGQPGRGIIVDMKRMDKVIEINEANMAVTAQCGITMGELSGKVGEKGFAIHTVGMPHYSDTLGGQISGEPGAGFGAYGYSMGFNWHYLLGMKVVLPNGRIVDTGTGEGSISTYHGHTWARGMHGPDMAGIFIGDGGIFGIKVEATYRMFRLPKYRKGGARCWDNFDQAYQAYYELWEIDPFIYMQSYASGMILSPEFMGIVDPESEPSWILYFLCVGNSEEEVEFKYKTTDAVCAKHGGKVASPTVMEFAPNFNSFVQDMNQMATLGLTPLFETFVSRRDVSDIFTWSREFFLKSLKERGIDPSRVPVMAGLSSAGIGYGISSIVPLLDQNDPELVEAIHEILLEYYKQAMRRGCPLDASQGLQSRLKARQWTPEFYDFVLSLKKTLDPNNIMNPGVYFV